MNAEIKKRLRAMAVWLDARPVRERVLLGAGAGCVVAALWSLLLMDPLIAQRTTLETETEQVRDEIRSIEEQGEVVMALHATDPNDELRDRAERLDEQIESLDDGIREHTVSMISPAEMARLLETMLAKHSSLRLVRLENLGAEPLLENAETGSSGVFKHRFEVVVKGGYLGTLRYVEALEALPWNFFWEALEYEVEEHPDGVATIRAYTLSAEEGWIGA